MIPYPYYTPGGWPIMYNANPPVMYNANPPVMFSAPPWPVPTSYGMDYGPPGESIPSPPESSPAPGDMHAVLAEIVELGQRLAAMLQNLPGCMDGGQQSYAHDDAVSHKISKIMHEGLHGHPASQRQAIAVALDMKRHGKI